MTENNDKIENTVLPKEVIDPLKDFVKNELKGSLLLSDSYASNIIKELGESNTVNDVYNAVNDQLSGKGKDTYKNLLESIKNYPIMVYGSNNYDAMTTPKKVSLKDFYSKGSAYWASTQGPGSNSMGGNTWVKAAKTVLGDTNKDGELSKSEALKHYDLNKDGKITDAEVNRFGPVDLIASNNREARGFTIGGVKVQSQSDLDISNLKKDYDKLRASSNPKDQKKADDIDRFFAMSPDEMRSFVESATIAEHLKNKAGVSATIKDENDPQWQQVINMSPEERAVVLKEANFAKGMSKAGGMFGLSGPDLSTPVGYKRIKTEAEKQQEEGSGVDTTSMAGINKASSNRAFGGMPGSSGQGKQVTRSAGSARVDTGWPSSASKVKTTVIPTSTPKKSSGPVKYL